MVLATHHSECPTSGGALGSMQPVNRISIKKVLLTNFLLCFPTIYLGGNDLDLEPLRAVKLLTKDKPGMRIGLMDCGLPMPQYLDSC